MRSVPVPVRSKVLLGRSRSKAKGGRSGPGPVQSSVRSVPVPGRSSTKYRGPALNTVGPRSGPSTFFCKFFHVAQPWTGPSYARSKLLGPVQSSVHKKTGRSRSGPVHRVPKVLGAPSNSVHGPVDRRIYTNYDHLYAHLHLYALRRCKRLTSHKV